VVLLVHVGWARQKRRRIMDLFLNDEFGDKDGFDDDFGDDEPFENNGLDGSDAYDPPTISSEEISIIGGISEEIARERRERDRLIRRHERENDMDYWEKIE
jgi:hypothetical protein